MLHSHKVRCGLVCALALAMFVSVGARRASGADKPAGSLEFVPADASFYSASLRLKEQVDIARQSKAWKRFLKIPVVQMGSQYLQAQFTPNSPLDMAQQMLELPENQQLVGLLGDMFSNEVFVYGDPNVTQFVATLAEGYGDAQATNMMNGLQSAVAQAQNGADPRETAKAKAASNREAAHAFLEVLADHLDDLTIPNVVLGFKISQTEPAVTQLKRLEVMAKMALKQSPQLKDRLQRTKIGDSEYLTLSLDGSLVPWQEIRWQDFEDEPNEFAPLVEKLKSLTLSLTLGIRGDYLLVSLGSSNEHLAKIGKGELLVDRPELKPLAAFAGKRLTSIAYSSGKLRAAVGTSKDDFDQISDSTTELLEQLKVAKPLQDRILKDVKSLVVDIKRYVPEIGSSMSFSFLTERGVEGYAYDWSENLFADASKPLTLLDHLGGNPLAALVMRSKYDPAEWDLVVKWAQVGYGYFQEFALPEMPADQRATYDQAANIALPLVARFESATRDLLLPALSDGQAALVLDAKISSRQWHKEMQKSSAPLPMIEPALVVGVSDANLLKRAIVEYLAIANRAIEEIRKADPKSIPADFKLPAPDKSDSKLGTKYSYPLPAEAWLDPRVSLNAGLSLDLAVFGLASEQTDLLLEKKPLELPKVLGDLQRPLAAVGWFDWAGLVDAVLPWIDYGSQLAGGNAAVDDVGGKGVQNQFIFDNIRASLKVLKVLRTYASVTYSDGKAMVVHSEVHFEDFD